MRLTKKFSTIHPRSPIKEGNRFICKGTESFGNTFFFGRGGQEIYDLNKRGAGGLIQSVFASPEMDEFSNRSMATLLKTDNTDRYNAGPRNRIYLLHILHNPVTL